MALTLKYKGFNYPDFYDGEYSASNLSASLPDVVTTGANSVALTPDFGIDIAASSVYAGGGTTDTTTDLAAAISAATQDGLTSFVRPLIDFLYPQESTAYPGNYYVPDGDSALNPNGYSTNNLPSGVTPSEVVTVPVGAYGDGDTVNYRGELSPLDINIAKFFGSPTTVGSYDYVIVQEAKAAQADGATLFSIGTELDSLADDTAATSYWKTLITDVRAVFSGKLTYSSNWATADQVTFWSKLDYVGIDGYVPLSNVVPDAAGDNNPTLASLVNAWSTPSNVVIAYSGGETVSQVTGGLSVIDDFDQLAQQSITKQFIFTEFGFQNDTGAATDPTGGSETGVLDPTLQAELYQSFFTAWTNAQNTAAADGGDVDGIPYSLAGAYIWEYDPDTSTYATTSNSYDNWTPSPQALSVIEAGFAATPAPIVVTETNVAGQAGYEGTPSPARGTAGTTGTGALAGDSDPSGTALTITAVQGGTVGSFFDTTYGSLELNANGSYVYYFEGGETAAPTGAPPVDTITYTVTDTLGASSTATLKITDYRDPTAVGENAAAKTGQTITGTAGTAGTGVLAGDTDPDGLTPTISAYYDPTLLNPPPTIGIAWAGKYGVVTIKPDGSYSYTADSAATLAQDFASDHGQPLVDGFYFVVAGGDGTYAVSTLSITIAPPPPPENYNATGRSDVLLQNSNGAIDILTTAASGLAISAAVSDGDPGGSWHVVGTADLNGDGQPDILLQNDNGTIVDYLMNGTGVAAAYDLGDAGSAWHVRGTADFSGDGNTDILLQSDSGSMVLWETNGTGIVATSYLGALPAGWAVEGIGDFYGTGQPDILVQNTSGTLVLYTMSGTTITAGAVIANPGPGWSVAGIADYNGDGKADIVLHNDNGSNVLWEMNGATVIGTASFGNPGASYAATVTGLDLNGDAAPDLVVQNTSTSTLVGYTTNDNAAITAGAVLGTPGAGWQAVGDNPAIFIDGTGSTLALTATAGPDQFVLTSFAAGLHTITGFDPAIDTVALSAAAFPSYATVQANEAPYQGGTFIGLSSTASVVIQGVTPSQLSAANFDLR
jgi:VCBS repeat-containing protein